MTAIEQVKLFEEDQPAQDKEQKDFPFLRWLGTGRSEAISMTFLARVTNVDKRTVRSMVHSARLCGHVICGDDNGYYLHGTEEELTAWIRREEAAIGAKIRGIQSAKIAQAEGRYPKAE